MDLLAVELYSNIYSLLDPFSKRCMRMASYRYFSMSRMPQGHPLIIDFKCLSKLYTDVQAHIQTFPNRRDVGYAGIEEIEICLDFMETTDEEWVMVSGTLLTLQPKVINILGLELYH